jgi:hypothetical protein
MFPRKRACAKRRSVIYSGYGSPPSGTVGAAGKFHRRGSFASSLDPASLLSILRGFRRASARVDINDFKDLPYVRGHPHGRKTV